MSPQLNLGTTIEHQESNSPLSVIDFNIISDPSIQSVETKNEMANKMSNSRRNKANRNHRRRTAMSTLWGNTIPPTHVILPNFSNEKDNTIEPVMLDTERSNEDDFFVSLDLPRRISQDNENRTPPLTTETPSFVSSGIDTLTQDLRNSIPNISPPLSQHRKYFGIQTKPYATAIQKWQSEYGQYKDDCTPEVSRNSISRTQNRVSSVVFSDFVEIREYEQESISAIDDEEESESLEQSELDENTETNDFTPQRYNTRTIRIKEGRINIPASTIPVVSP